MKPKTFTYNEIIKFFLTNGLPLSDKQVYLIGTKVKEELAVLEIYHIEQKKKRDAKLNAALEQEEEKGETELNEGSSSSEIEGQNFVPKSEKETTREADIKGSE